MSFATPAYFLLLPALVLVGWFFRGLKLHSPLRAAILLLAVLALAAPEIRRQQNALDLFVLLDRSDSTEAKIDQNLPEWQRLLERSKPSRQDALHWINYAAEVAELGADGSSFTGSRHLTRSALALSTVAAMADASRPARILMFSDGFSTEPIQEAVQQLRARGIPLDLRLLHEENDSDFRIARLAFPERVQTGEPFLIQISVKGHGNSSFPLVIRRNGAVLGESTVTLNHGAATVEFTDRIARPAGYEYQAEIRPPQDAHPGNNRASRWLEVAGGPRLLVVSHFPDDPLVKVLSGMEFAVELETNPATLHPGRLSGARAVILNNVRADEMPAPFLKSLDFFVREQGGGLLMAGGPQSFGAGGFFQSPIDALLPVSMELKSEHRKLAVALAIVLDRSGSMAVSIGGGQTKMDLANSGAAAAIQLLGPMDQVAVLAVDSEPTKVVPLTSVGNQHQALSGRVMKVRSSGGGIYVYEGLKAAWKELETSPAGTRHVILFSDAQDSEEPGDYKKLLRTMAKGGCTVSVIGLGTDHDVDAELLKDIAKRGKGRIFFSDQPMDLPKIFAQETVTIARSAFLKEPFPTQATGRWMEISPKPLTWPNSLDGYNLSYARPDATVSLASADEYHAPLVAHARRGLGRTVAVSFPLGGEFSAASRQWPAYGDFLQTLSRFLIGSQTPPGVSLRHRLDGTRLTLDLRYDPETWSKIFALTPPTIRLSSETDGSPPKTPAWRRMEPGRFSLSLDLAEGSFVRGAVRCGDHALAFGPLGVGSSAEWSFDPDRLNELKSACASSGGRELLDLSQAWQRPSQLATTPLHQPLLVLLVLMVLADALATRTSWRLPQWKFSVRLRPSVLSHTVAPPSVASTLPTPPPPAPPTPPTATPISSQSERFARAKARK